VSEPCRHVAEHGEGVEWPIDVSLDHFDNCLTPERRLDFYTRMRQWAVEATQCLIADHAGLLHEVQLLRERNGALVRELADRPRRKAARIAYRAPARRRTRSHR